MNGFEKHGLNHTSASQINMYANAPCAWAAKYLYGQKFPFGLAPRAGVLVEDAVAAVLSGEMNAQDATEQAVKTYNKASAIGATKSEEKRGEGIPSMIELALAELEPFGKPEFDVCLQKGRKQKSIELLCNGDGWSLPIVGYTDFDYPDHGLIVDLKTTMKMPSVMSAEHTRQGAIYKKASGNHAVKFLYVTPKKAAWLEVDDVGPPLAEVKNILNRQEKMLQLSNDQIQEIMPVNASSFYWGGAEQIRKDIYGM
jgi:hypothetical protein